MKERIYNLIWLFSEQGVKILSSLFVTLIVVKYLGAEKFGLLSLAIAFITFLGAFTGLGFNAILFKRFASKENNETQLLEISQFLRLVVAVIVIVIVSLLNLLIDSDLLNLINILSIGFLFDSFLSFKDYFFATMKSKYYTYSTTLSLLIQAIIILFLISYDATLNTLALAYVGTKFVQVLVLYSCYLIEKKTLIFPRFNKDLSKDLLVSSYPMILATSIGILYNLQDQFFISFFLNNYELGLYAVGIKFVLILIIIPTLISNVFYPSLVKKYTEGNFKAYSEQVNSLYLLFFCLGIMGFIFTYLLSESIISLLFSDEFSRSSEIMKIYSVLLLLSFFQSLNNKVLILHNLQNIIFKRAILALCVNGILNYFLIPIYGINGAAYSTVISEFLVILSYAIKSETRFIFIYQLKSLLIFRIFHPNFFKGLKS
jgi:O-antigen/teichoic acid export membrane protein